MEAPRVGNGADFNPSAPYRMYHGSLMPGFPQHPHRGFETITATIDGIIDHSDSHGNAGRYGEGDVQWMTAGKGVVHGEMFPLISDKRNNPTRFFQLWLNLPAKDKMAEPSFAMHWSDEVPKVTFADGAKLTVFAGKFNNTVARPPCPSSWAADPSHDVGAWHITLPRGSEIELPKSGQPNCNRAVYSIEGGTYQIDGQTIDPETLVTLDAQKATILSNKVQEGKRKRPEDMSVKELKAEVAKRGLQALALGFNEKGEFVSLLNDKSTNDKSTNDNSDDSVEFLVLQGVPISEPVAQHGPFVMNTQGEIQQAFADYRKTEFGGWPWPEDAMAFPREKGRFSLLNGEETYPPGCDGTWPEGWMEGVTNGKSNTEL